MESEAAKLLMSITNSPDDDLSVKNRFLCDFSGFSPVNQLAQARTTMKLFLSERAHKTTSENPKRKFRKV